MEREERPNPQFLIPNCTIKRDARTLLYKHGEEKIIKKLMADFRKSLRPQMDVKDSTQNFYLK